MSLLTLNHDGWVLEVNYYVDGDYYPASMDGPEEFPELMWDIERVVEEGHADDYPTSAEIMEAIEQDNDL
jgi:hypothetical protein